MFLTFAMLASIQLFGPVPEDVSEILSLCREPGGPECDAEVMNVDLFVKRERMGSQGTEILIFCRSNRADAARLVDGALRSALTRAGIGIVWNGSTEESYAMVAERGLPARRYRLEADLSGVPIRSGSRERCTLRMEALVSVRDAAHRWRPAGRDSFTRDAAQSVYLATSMPAPAVPLKE